MFNMESEDKAKVTIKIFVDEKNKQKQEEIKMQEEKKKKKEEKYMKDVKSKVFGQTYDPKKDEINLKNRPDYTEPKDKWKTGRELLEL